MSRLALLDTAVCVVPQPACSLCFMLAEMFGLLAVGIGDGPRLALTAFTTNDDNPDSRHARQQ